MNLLLFIIQYLGGWIYVSLIAAALAYKLSVAIGNIIDRLAGDC